MKTIVLLFAIACLGLATHAQWVPTNGPFGGLTYRYAQNDDVLYTGTAHGGVFVSENNGESWQKRNNGFTALGPSGLGVGALYADNEVAYVGIGVNGFYRSYDDGLNWESMPGFWSSYVLTTIARMDNHLFVGNAGAGLQRSEDNGATWMASMNGILPAMHYTVMDIVIKAPFVYVLINGKMYRSEDNGSEWNLLSSGIPENTYGLNLCDDVLVAVTSQGMYRSTDDGDLWSISNTGIDTQTIPYLKCTTSGDDIFICDQYYSVFYTSNDQGITWIPIDYPFENALYAFYALGDGDLLFQTSYQSNFNITDEPCGLYLSEDDGSTWVNITNEIDGTFCMSLASVGNDLFCSTNSNGVYKSSDNGESWSLTGLTNWQVRVIRNLNGQIFAGGSNGIYRSTDGGSTWVYGSQGLTNSSVNDFVNIDDNLFVATADGVFISTDNGDSWSQQNNGITSPYVFSLMLDGTTLYAGAYGGVFMSTNFGNSWQLMGTGLPLDVYISSVVSYNGNLLAATAQGIFRLPAGSSVWEQVAQGLLVSDAYRLKVAGDKIFASRIAPVVGYDGVFVSFDGGITWEGQSEGITNNQVWEIEVHGDYLFAATLGSGCFKRDLAEFIPLNVIATDQQGFGIYPNPASNAFQLQIQNDQLGEQMAVYNALGSLVYELSTTTSTQTTINCLSWPAGYYVVRVGSSSNVFIKQ